MFEPLKNMFAPKGAKIRASLPDGQRAYVIGDIHGRNDLFKALIQAILEDDKAQSAADTSIILLGDLIDRGPDSAGVIRSARDLQNQAQLRCLTGNHEEMFLDAFNDANVLRHFLKHGGRETVLSYGIDRAEFDNSSLKHLQALMREKVPDEDIEFLESFEDMIELGDYLFVHAGIDPTKALEDQTPRELRWIRDSFLNYKERHSHIVVHGHTITEKIDERKNRIGVDTGAYRYGRLTALVLEGERRRYIQAVATGKGAIKIATDDAA